MRNLKTFKEDINMSKQKSNRNLEKVAEILIRLVAEKDEHQRSLLSTTGVLLLMEEIKTENTYNWDDIDVPDFMRH
jgi:hypothetical protein